MIPGTSSATGGLSARTVATFLREHWNSFQYCWELASGKGEAPAKGLLKLNIDPDGAVANATIELADRPYLQGCITTKAARIRFLTGRQATRFEQQLVFTGPD